MFSGKWTTPVVHGELPPPCVDFSFTYLGDYRTLMYGGFQPESGTSNEAYVLNMETWVSGSTEQRRLIWFLVLNSYYPRPSDCYNLEVCAGMLCSVIGHIGY